MKLCLSLLLLCISINTIAQNQLKTLKTNQKQLTIREGIDGRGRGWRISPQLKPDELIVEIKGKSQTVSFISELDSLTYTVEPGKSYDFLVLAGKDSALTRITGVRPVPAAVFSNAYKKANDKKTLVEIPQIYELINIIIAITPTGQKDQDLVYHDSPYYAAVQEWFKPFAKDTIVMKIDGALKNDGYYTLKMDGYTFDQVAPNKIRQSKVYDRASWGKSNTLRPFIPEMEDFARRSDFNKFYKAHQSFYNDQIRCYEDSLDTKAMISWLRANFSATTYNTFKIIFSPLVAYNQSANWFENNGFKEAQAHVNFPYLAPGMRKHWSDSAILLFRGQIVFTELNHSFINPQMDINSNNSDYKQAFENLDLWLDKTKAAAGYNSPYACFNEFMNWGLVSLYTADKAPEREKKKIIEGVGKHIQNNRGFKKFDAFNSFLVELYVNRPKGKTLADLYPEILHWFNTNKG